MKQNPTIDMAAIILLLIGGLNWGFVGLLDFDIIGAVFGIFLARIIFVLMGFAAIWRIVWWVMSSNRNGKSAK